jgi:ADP-ribose pyrophosphatase
MKTIDIYGKVHLEQHTKLREACRGIVIRNDEILLTYEVNTDQWFIPGGGLENNETPEDCVVRELREETGATAEKIIPLGELYPTPGYCGETIWLFGAKGLTFGETDPDEDEFLEVERIPLEKAVDMILSGEIKDAKTQAAVLKVKLLVDRNEF